MGIYDVLKTLPDYKITVDGKTLPRFYSGVANVGSFYNRGGNNRVSKFVSQSDDEPEERFFDDVEEPNNNDLDDDDEPPPPRRRRQMIEKQNKDKALTREAGARAIGIYKQPATEQHTNELRKKRSELLNHDAYRKAEKFGMERLLKK